MIVKPLGGDTRLGAGGRMNVMMQNYGRSNHELGYIWKSTVSPGTVVPFMCELALAGDTFDIDLACDILTLPTIGPLFGSFKIQLDCFQIPLRLYNSYLHNNKRGIGLEMSKVKFPQIELVAKANTGEPEDIDNCQINPSCLLSYLGIRGVGYNPQVTDKTRQFNAAAILAYYETCSYYYSNLQEGKGAVIHCAPMTATAQTVDAITAHNPDETLSWEIAQEPAISTPNTLQAGFTIQIDYTGTQPDPRQILIIMFTGEVISYYDLVGGAYQSGGGTISGIYNATRWGGLQPKQWKYATAGNAITTEPRVVTFDIDNIDEMRERILAYRSESVPFVLNTDGNIAPYQWLWEQPGNFPNMLCSQEGLWVKTYLSDFYQNWLDTDKINSINTRSSVSTAGGSFTMDQLNVAEKLYYLLNRVQVSGGTYFDWLETVYGTEPIMSAETPMYIGGAMYELQFQQVISNSASENQPLGTLAGRGKINDRKGGKIITKVKEPSIIMGLFSITPRLDYSTENRYFSQLKTWDDMHKPQLDQIGFEDLITERFAWWDTYNNGTNWITKSVGKQPAWTQYTSNVNRTYGNFAIRNNSMFMTLNRRYEPDYSQATPIEILDMTTYIDPTKFNHIFSETSLDAMNFWVSIGVGIEARRVMSAAVMPTL